MTQKEKQLLLEDLCSRLPYGVIVQVKDWTTLDAELKTGHIRLLQEDEIELKPYLRPMSSMTEEERKYLQKLPFPYDFVDWLTAHHFDYRNLIEKGLALEASDRIYNVNKK